MKYAKFVPRSRPHQWSTGENPQRRDSYYAFLKHRAQARYRGESYSLDFSDWEQFWPPELYEQRGTSSHNLCLRQIDPEGGWHAHNCEVVTVHEHRSAPRKRRETEQTSG